LNKVLVVCRGQFAAVANAGPDRVAVGISLHELDNFKVSESFS
jgi:hypothetical protein